MAFIFGVDLDGVCANYTAALRPFVAQRFNVNPETLTDDISWNFVEWGMTSREQYLDIHAEAVVKRRIFATMPTIEGAAETLWRLSDAGVWIRIITHRLQVKGGHANAVSDTCTWLDAHNIPYRDLCFLGAKPQVEADVYIDDSPDNVNALRESGNDVIVFDQPYNREISGPRAHSWQEVETYVLDRMESFVTNGRSLETPNVPGADGAGWKTTPVG